MQILFYIAHSFDIACLSRRQEKWKKHQMIAIRLLIIGVCLGLKVMNKLFWFRPNSNESQSGM